MGVREALNKNPKTAAIVVVALLALGGGIAFLMTRGGAGEATVQETVFFTVDDGKTWFPDRADKLYPFERDGKLAYRVQVYKCGGDPKPFAAYIQRIEANALKEAQAAQAAGKKREEIERIWEARLEVKSPGGTEWVPQRGQAGEKVTAPKCPPGQTPVIVLP